MQDEGRLLNAPHVMQQEIGNVNIWHPNSWINTGGRLASLSWLSHSLFFVSVVSVFIAPELHPARREQSQLLQHHLLRVCRRRVDLQGRYSATDGCHVTPCRPVNSSVCDFAEHHRRQRRSSLFGFKPDVLVFVNSCSELKINPFDPILSGWKTKIVFVLNLVPRARSAPNSVIEMQLWSWFQLQLRFLDNLSQGQSVTRWKHTRGDQRPTKASLKTSDQKDHIHVKMETIWTNF